MHIKPDTLRTFVTVADCGTLAEASAILKRTPSAISMTLKMLEEQLDAELFETDRKSALTPLGQFVLEESRRALNSFDEAILSMQRFAYGEVGTVRVATVPSVATRLLPTVSQKFRQSTPNVRLELRDLDSSLVATSVRNGSVDFGVASLSGATGDLITESLLEEPFGVVCTAHHPLTQTTTPVRWSQLQHVHFISNDLCKQISSPGAAAINNHASIHIYNVGTLLSFIRQDMGVTLLPRLAVPEDQGLVFLPLEDNSAVRKLYFLQHKHHRLNPATKAFKQCMLDITAELYPKK